MREHHPFIRRLGQWASFRVAYTVSLLSPLAVLGWAFLDAWFWKTMGVVGGFAGFGPAHVDTFSAAWHWNGARLLILPSLIAISALAAAIVVVRLLLGTKRDRSLLSWMLAMLLIGVWCGVLLGVVRYPDAQLRYRLRRDMWRFQTVADTITTAGRIPASAKTEIGEIRCGSFDTDRFPGGFLPHNRRSIHEDVQGIWTLDDGALLFTIYPSRIALEFHPRRTRPSQRFSTRKHGFHGIHVPSFADLGGGWFLVRRDQP
jgi:hypothetical protein